MAKYAEGAVQISEKAEVAQYELVIRTGTVATAGDVVTAGHTQPKYHAASRPPPVEREATHRAATLAEIADTPVLIVHVSGAEAIDQIRAAQARGVRVYAETCPQYLFLTADDLDLEGFEGAKCICSPHHNVDYTPYEGMQLTGWPETTNSRGTVVCDGGELKAEAGRGEFLRCATPEPASVPSVA